MNFNGINAGLELVVCIFAGAGIGLGLDKVLGTMPFLTIPGIFLGMVCGLWIASREMK